MIMKPRLEAGCLVHVAACWNLLLGSPAEEVDELGRMLPMVSPAWSLEAWGFLVTLVCRRTLF